MRRFYPRRERVLGALLLLVVGLLMPGFAQAESVTQPDVALVRAEGNPSSPVVTRLPINTPVEITDPVPTAAGYLAIKVYNQLAMASSEPQVLLGYIHADLLGPWVTAKGLEAQLTDATTSPERITILERIVALRGEVSDRQRLFTEAAMSGDAGLVSRTQQYLQPAPSVIGVCLGGRVAILAEIKNGKAIPLGDEFPESTLDSPEVLKSAKRLQAYALQLTTRKFYAQNAVFSSETAYLLQPRVVTTEDVMSTIRNYIDLGPCPLTFGEVLSAPGTVFTTQKIRPRLPGGDLGATELVPMIKAMDHGMSALAVAAPGGGLVELNTPNATWIFNRSTSAVLACSDVDRCHVRSITRTAKPMWSEFESGEWVRIGSTSEDVTAAGWGSPDNEGLWASPVFVIQIYKDQQLSGEIVVTLALYGC